MGCVSSKRILRSTSFQEILKRPFPPVTAIPILDDLVLANSHEFVALICKANKLAKKLPAPSEPENVLPFISKYSEGERLITENHVRVNSDMQSESSLKEEKLEKHEAAEGESEEYKPTEEDKTEVIFTWELLEGLDDGETYHVSMKTGSDSDSLSANSSDKHEEMTDKNSPARISISKSLESFHTVEEYDAFLARRKSLPLWDRNSKRHLYYSGHEHIETINEFSSTSQSSLSSCPSLSLTERNMIPVVINWREDSEDDDDCSFEISVLQPSFDLSDTKTDVNSYIAQTIAENSGNQENSRGVETSIGITDLAEANLEKDQPTETKSGERRMHVRAKLNDLGGITIPRTPEFSAVGSLREWLTGGGHIYSPGVSTELSLGYFEFGDKSCKANDAGSSGQPSGDGAKVETDYCPVFNIDDKLANDGDSSVYSDSGVFAIENKKWDYPLFDPELLALFEKALQQLSEEEQHLLRQFDEDSNLPCRKSCAKDNEDNLQGSSRTEDTDRKNTCLSNNGEF